MHRINKVIKTRAIEEARCPVQIKILVVQYK